MAVAVPPRPMGRARMGPRGSSVVPLAGIQLWNSLVPPVPSQLLAWSLLPVPGTAVSASPPQGDHDTNTAGTAASPAPAPAQGLGVPLAPLSCLQPQQGRIPAFPESSHLPFAPPKGAEPGAARSLLPINGSFLAWLRQQRALCGLGGPGGRALAPSPLVPCQPPPGRGVPVPPTRLRRGWAGWGGRNSRKWDLGRRGARLDVPGWQRGSSALGPGPLPDFWAQPDFHPPLHLGATAGRKMRLQGRGHAGWDVDFHREMPSGLLTLGGYHKATGNPQRRRGGVGFFRKSTFHPYP